MSLIKTKTKTKTEVSHLNHKLLFFVFLKAHYPNAMQPAPECKT